MASDRSQHAATDDVSGEREESKSRYQTWLIYCCADPKRLHSNHDRHSETVRSTLADRPVTTNHREP